MSFSFYILRLLACVLIASKMIYHRGGGGGGGGGRAGLNRACIADLMFCHGTQTIDNSRICHCPLFHEHGKQNFVQPFALARVQI